MALFLPATATLSCAWMAALSSDEVLIEKENAAGKDRIDKPRASPRWLIRAVVVLDLVGVVSVDLHRDQHPAAREQFFEKFAVQQLRMHIIFPMLRAVCLKLELLFAKIGVLRNEAGADPILTKSEDPDPTFLLRSQIDVERKPLPATG